MVKLSRFNVVLDEDEERLILFNTFSKKHIKITHSRGKSKDEIFNTIIQNPRYYPKLIEDKFIIEENCNEDVLCDELYYRETSGDTSLRYTVIPTRNCNFDCIYCSQPHVKQTMDDKTIGTILKSLKKRLNHYSSFVLSFYGGEPMIEHENCLKLLDGSIDICKRIARNFTAYMTTNGYLLTEQRFRELLSRHVTYYHITLDGSPLIHNYQRPLASGAPSFDTIMDNLISIKNNVHSNMFHITLRTNISQAIYENIDDFIEILSRHFKNDKRFNLYWRWAEDFGGERVKDHFQEFVTIGQVNAATKKAVEAGLILYNDTLYSAKKGALICEASKENYYAIDYDAKLLKCTHWDKPEYSVIGKILENGDFEIDRQKEAFYKLKVPRPKCRKCYFEPLCQGKLCPIGNISINSGCFKIRDFFVNGLRLSAKTSMNKIEEVVL